MGHHPVETSFDYVEGMSASPNGNIVITGSFDGDSMRFGNFTLYQPVQGSGYAVFFIAELNSSGQVLWATCAGGTGTGTYGRAVTTDGDGNVYVAGQYSGANMTLGGDTFAGYGTSVFSNDIFIAKYDSNGHFEWAQNAGGSQNDYPNGIATDNRGNVYLTGTFDSDTLNFGETPVLIPHPVQQPVITMYFIARFNAGGNMLWARAIGGTLSDEGEAIQWMPVAMYMLQTFASDSFNYDGLVLTHGAFAGDAFMLELIQTPGRFAYRV